MSGRSSTRAKSDPETSLVIVESPAKVKTISRYLGPNFVVKSSVGHIRDLPGRARRGGAGRNAGGSPGGQTALVRRMGIDPEHGWVARYEVIPGKEKVLKELQAAAKKAAAVYLATDLDREGEAIAWHLKELLGGRENRYLRVTFPEITRRAVEEAFASPGEINQNRVQAQQARRFLDRVVGFMASPLLWKKVARGLSAGRVQSVALRLVVEREREIKAFVPEEYWEVTAFLELPDDKDAFPAQVVRRAGRPFRPASRGETESALAELKGAAYRVAKVEAKPRRVSPTPPFTTSTLQQAASVRLGFGVKKTMALAQKLYEAGYITYMRTDSTNLSRDSISSCRTYIAEAFGEQYLPETPRKYAGRAHAQEAHEAIRPSDVRREADNLPGMDRGASRLYDLIWRQFIACQMPPALYEVNTASIKAGEYDLRARGRVLLFDGWLKVMPPRKSGNDFELPLLKAGEDLRLRDLVPEQHFTKPPARYSEASLVKELTRRGIGRPSTYASIISTIEERGYVRLEKKRLYAAKIGEVVTDRLVHSFADIMDYGFTARLEEKLDEIAEGKLDWKKVLDDFYRDFSADLDRAEEEMPPNDPTPTEILCPTCGRPMQVRNAATGVFLGCSGYGLPKDSRCTRTINLVSDDEVVELDNGEDAASGSEEDSRALRRRRRCPLCGSAMDGYLVDEKRKLHVCGRNPECPGTRREEGNFKIKGYEGPVLECDRCGAQMELKSGRYGKYFSCSSPDCKNTRKLRRDGTPAPPKAVPVPMPELKCARSDGHFVLRDGAAGIFLASNKYPRSRETRNPRVEDLVRHREELDPKFLYLCEAPPADPDGNPTVIRFHRKQKRQYVVGEADGKPTGWSAEYEDGRWVPRESLRGTPGRKKPKG